jgi:hypothetical protein
VLVAFGFVSKKVHDGVLRRIVKSETRKEGGVEEEKRCGAVGAITELVA